MLASCWQEFLGQSVLVANVPRAGGVIGVTLLIHSKPDEYTLVSAYDSLMVALPFTNKSATYTLDNFDCLEGYGLGAVWVWDDEHQPRVNGRRPIIEILLWPA